MTTQTIPVQNTMINVNNDNTNQSCQKHYSKHINNNNTNHSCQLRIKINMYNDNSTTSPIQKHYNKHMKNDNNTNQSCQKKNN